MFTKIMQWVSVTPLLLASTWHPSANYQTLLHLAVCAGAVLVILALFFIKHEIETHDGVDNRFNPARRVTVKLRAWRS